MKCDRDHEEDDDHEIDFIIMPSYAGQEAKISSEQTAQSEQNGGYEMPKGDEPFILSYYYYTALRSSSSRFMVQFYSDITAKCLFQQGALAKRRMRLRKASPGYERQKSQSCNFPKGALLLITNT